MSTPTTAAGIFTDAIDDIVADLTALGLAVVTDPRAARPYSVFVELPTFDGFTARIADATVVLRVLASPPGDQNAANYLLKITDQIMAANLAVVSGRPTAALIGDQSIPAYDLTVRIAIRREPTPPPTP
jgi:hypothetical protein